MAAHWLVCECNPNYPGATPTLGIIQYCQDCNKWICLKCRVGHPLVCDAPMSAEERAELARLRQPAEFEE